MENLLSEQGIALRQLRCIELENVFSNIKHNLGFRRFHLRGLEKVETEWSLVCIAHNMRKLVAILPPVFLSLPVFWLLIPFSTPQSTFIDSLLLIGLGKIMSRELKS